MSEAVQEIKICSKCDAEIREGSLFCYGCGADLGLTPVSDETALQSDEASKEPTPEEMERMFEPQIEAIPKPDIDIEGKAAIAKPEVKRTPPVKKNLQTAASIRQKKEKKTPVQKVYTWQENTESTIYFVIGAIIFIITGVSLVFLGLYIR